MHFSYFLQISEINRPLEVLPLGEEGHLSISPPHYPASTFPHTRVLGEAEEDGKAPHIWAYKPPAAFPQREFPNWNQQTLGVCWQQQNYVGIKRLSVSAEGLANR